MSGMDASPVLVRVVAALAKHKLDTVLIGNAAAAILGAPVTTLDFDFMFRDTPTNLRKLKAVAGSPCRSSNGCTFSGSAFPAAEAASERG